MTDYYKEKTKLFQDTISISEFNPIIEDMLTKMEESYCDIGFFPGTVRKKSSYYNPRGIRDSKREGYIGLYNFPGRDKLNILWDMFHEFGHHQDPNYSKGERRRETKAWLFADKHFADYDVLEKYQQHYSKYQDECILPYFKD